MRMRSDNLQDSISACCRKGKEWAEASGGNGLAMGGADCDVFPAEYEEAVELKYRVSGIGTTSRW